MWTLFSKLFFAGRIFGLQIDGASGSFTRARRWETLLTGAPCGVGRPRRTKCRPERPVLRSGALEFLHPQWWFGACAHFVFGDTWGELDERQPAVFTGVRVRRDDVDDGEVGDDALDDGFAGVRQRALVDDLVGTVLGHVLHQHDDPFGAVYQ